MPAVDFPVVMVSPDGAECSVHNAVDLNNLAARGYTRRIEGVKFASGGVIEPAKVADASEPRNKTAK